MMMPLLLHDRFLLNHDELDLSPAPDIPPSRMAVAACPVVIVVLVSLYLRLGNVRTLVVAAFRCVVQLLLLGLLLYPIFRNNQTYVVLPYVFVMIIFATREASVKPKHRYVGMARDMLLAITLGLSISLSVISFGVLQPDPWWDAQVIIPVGGMMLGSCVNALSLGTDRFLLTLSGSGRGSAALQTYLACGASPWEASLPSLREAIETGLTPNLNQMSVMGLVSIPGMFTGQILGGTPPLVAAKYQIVIMFFVCSNSFMILLLVMLQAIFFRLFENGSFRADLVSRRKGGGKPKDIVMALISYLVVADVWKRVRRVHQRSSCVKDDDDDDIRKGSSLSSPVPAFSNATFRHVHHGEAQDDGRECLLALSNGKISLGNTTILSTLNFQLKEGEIAILRGPSGCGKSTCLRALSMLQRLDEGVLELRGRPAEQATTWRSEVLYVRQSGGLGLPGTPRGLLDHLRRLQSQSARQQMQHKDPLERYLEALDLEPAMVDQKWDLMSGGEAQRVYLCLLLALHPSVLLLDEPTSACDERSARRVEELIVELGIAAVWVSHDPAQMERLQQLDQVSLYEFFHEGGGHSHGSVVDV